ncbi:hypothetical protein SAMN04488577_2165 [Bacillus sp. cl95]|nr:hypothetical protein SAMN02799634_10246 [Bacillus sp. UNCCL13]SFQ83488.1 hypothetical protein SAMN04488577_2165 [Bacillus sp. cl95]
MEVLTFLWFHYDGMTIILRKASETSFNLSGSLARVQKFIKLVI